MKVVNQHNHPLTAGDLHQEFSTTASSHIYRKVQSPLPCDGMKDEEEHQFLYPTTQLVEAAQKYENMFLKPNTSL